MIFKDVSGKKGRGHAYKVHVLWEDYHVPLYGFSVGLLHSQPIPRTLSEFYENRSNENGIWEGWVIMPGESLIKYCEN